MPALERVCGAQSIIAVGSVESSASAEHEDMHDSDNMSNQQVKPSENLENDDMFFFSSRDCCLCVCTSQ